MSICLSVCLSVFLFVCLSVSLFVCLSVCLYVFLSVCLSLFLYVCLCVRLYLCSVFLFVCLFSYLSICPYVCLSLCLSICLFVCLSDDVCLQSTSSRGLAESTLPDILPGLRDKERETPTKIESRSYQLALSALLVTRRSCQMSAYNTQIDAPRFGSDGATAISSAAESSGREGLHGVRKGKCLCWKWLRRWKKSTVVGGVKTENRRWEGLQPICGWGESVWV